MSQMKKIPLIQPFCGECIGKTQLLLSLRETCAVVQRLLSSLAKVSESPSDLRGSTQVPR